MSNKTNVFNPKNSELGKKSAYDCQYNPDKLFPIPRKSKREEIGILGSILPFYGFDCWNHYEVSWLNEKGKPIIAHAEIFYDCESPNIIESKSMKLYFNSLNNTKFSSIGDVKATIIHDLEKRLEAQVHVNITPLSAVKENILQTSFDGECLDNLDIECSTYMVDSSLLFTHDQDVEETLYSDLLKSNCLVTGQPDWGSVQIQYVGKKISHEGLLKYLVSFRNHNEFHEQCIERIFVDIITRCKPTELVVYGRYTRRGGLDINPLRATKKIDFKIMNGRLYRQ